MRYNTGVQKNIAQQKRRKIQLGRYKEKVTFFIISLKAEFVKWFFVGKGEKEVEMSDRQLVRVALENSGLSQKWLYLRLRRRGMNISKEALSAALSGYRTSERSREIVENSLEEIKNYQERMES